jgi:uncharacterized transporter YbjL
VTRQGLEFTPTPGFRLQFGDILMVVGEAPQIDAVSTVVGNSPKALDTPQPLTFFLGIVLGVIVGSIPLVLPGLPAAVKLGLAGGPLVVAILMSRLTTTGPLIWHVPHTANHMIREIGITILRYPLDRRGADISAGMAGKAKTALQIFALTIFIAPKDNTLPYLAMGGAVVATLWSGASIVRAAWPVLRAPAAGSEPR